MPTDEPEPSPEKTKEGLQPCPVCNSKQTFFHPPAFKMGWCAACGAAFDYVLTVWERLGVDGEDGPPVAVLEKGAG